MGFNIAGLLVKKKISESEIEKLLESNITFSEETAFEKATSNFRDPGTVDILQSETGTLIITPLGQVYDVTRSESDIIQFMISDVSDTYYFEKYSNGKLLRKYISSQGEMVEDVGEGIISQEDDLIDKIWEFTEEYLQNDFFKKMFELKFKRYKL
jgi:hypothetical protein